eukprot:TRINITY_DN19972_c0_g1_i1.p1 TRINITY_DN19972_c0_g1~~TRINITY_DN19972_c0_g1_i1.p1  ORF type:complete len:246 (-),score=30.88 TRINITY_DN19972_c0_g1_i1:101-838(-)
MGGCCGKPQQLDSCGLASYEPILSRLRPGDLILFRSKTLKAAAQRLVCKAEFDHVAILVHDWHCGEDGTLPCCPSEMKDWRNKLHAIDRSDPHFLPWHTLEATGSGVDVYPFNRKRIRMYNGVVAVRRLQIPEELRAEFEKKLMEFVNRVKGCPYPSNVISLLRAASILGPSKDPSDLQSFFCSELVAACYQHAGVLSSARFANMYVPGDFSTTGCPRRAAKLNPRYHCHDYPRTTVMTARMQPS